MSWKILSNWHGRSTHLNGFFYATSLGLCATGLEIHYLIIYHDTNKSIIFMYKIWIYISSDFGWKILLNWHVRSTHLNGFSCATCMVLCATGLVIYSLIIYHEPNKSIIFMYKIWIYYFSFSMKDSFKLTGTFHAFEWIFLCYTFAIVCNRVGILFHDCITYRIGA